MVSICAGTRISVGIINDDDKGMVPWCKPTRVKVVTGISTVITAEAIPEMVLCLHRAAIGIVNVKLDSFDGAVRIVGVSVGVIYLSF